MLASRARLGLIVPSCNVIAESDAVQLLPRGVSGHFARMKITRDTEEQINALIDHVPQAATDLADAAVDVIGFACTTGSLIRGLGYDAEITGLITRLTGIKATTTASAVVEAMRLLQMRRIVIVSPYEDWLNAKEEAFLQASGFTVVGMRGLALPDPRDCERVSGEEIRQVVRSMDCTDADGVFISCTDFQGLDAAEALEHDLGKPVVTSNQATLWKMLRMAGVEDRIEGFGRLLRQ